MIELGLQRMSRLMADTPMPWRAIHVAGTNGKGSVCAYISEMLNVWNQSRWRRDLQNPVLRHGRFTSPHLVDPWDCISLSNKEHKMQPLDSHEFHDIMSQVAERNRKHAINATQFELLTATAFEVFTRAKVDVAVVEVGMGGRLDSTNIIGQPALNDDGDEKAVDMETFRPPPLVSVITKIGMDHQGFLGNTIEEIAREKAGIIKPGVPVVYDVTNDGSVCQTLEGLADANAAPTHSVRGQRRDGGPAHQVQNHAVALTATRMALMRLKNLVDNESSQVPNDLQGSWQKVIQIPFAGRQEQIDIGLTLDLKTSKIALLDGAHNAQSAEALGNFLEVRNNEAGRTTAGRPPITWILAASDSKDMTSILRPLIRGGDSVIAVEFGPVEGMPWVNPMNSATVLALAKEAVTDLAATKNYGGDIPGALKEAAASNNEIIITGSLYLVGDVHRLLRRSRR